MRCAAVLAVLVVLVGCANRAKISYTYGWSIEVETKSSSERLRDRAQRVTDQRQILNQNESP